MSRAYRRREPDLVVPPRTRSTVLATLALAVELHEQAWRRVESAALAMIAAVDDVERTARILREGQAALADAALSPDAPRHQP